MVRRSRLSRFGRKPRSVRLVIQVTDKEARAVTDEMVLAIVRLKKDNPSYGNEILDELDISDEYFKALVKKIRGKV